MERPFRILLFEMAFYSFEDKLYRMNTKIILNKLSYPFFLAILLLVALQPVSAQRTKTGKGKNQQVISYVDTSLDNSQKYVLRVDGKPFYMNNVQVRLDLLRYAQGWNAQARETLIAQAAADGFNTLSIPIHWYEVEPEKDKFNWTVLDEYLGYMNKYDIKMEMLWFGTNSGGHVQWLGRDNKEGNHLRTPDYVLYSPEPGSKETTSEYNIRRDMSDYSVDLRDNRLRERETYVLGKVMAHIAEWDKANGSKHPVIGVQIGNEVIGQRLPYSNSLVISYLSDVAGAIKNSDYVVWTRVNCVFWKIPSRIHENESRHLSTEGTNLDFIGIDTYRHHFRSDADFVASMRTNLPYVGKNYRMIMETNSNVPYAAQMHLAALSGNNAFNLYSIESFYGKDGDSIKPLVQYLEDIRLVNKILNSDIVDIATKAHGYGLFVHNWQGVNSTTTISNAGIGFAPGYPTSQGISILRSDTEIVLMSSKGGRFTLPDSLNITYASKGYFDTDNKWVNQGEVPFKKFTEFDSSTPRDASVFVDAGTTVRLIRKDSGNANPHKIYQAEFAQLGGGAQTEADIENIGFAGNGYVPFISSGGSYIVWSGVDGQSGGERTIKIRYSHAGERPTKHVLYVNGKEFIIRLETTENRQTYKLFTTTVPLNPGANNEIRLESADNHYRINGVVYYQLGGNIDELQVY